MSYGTYFKPDLFISRISLDNKNKVDEKISELEVELEKNKANLVGMYFADKKILVNDETEDIFFTAKHRMLECLEEITDLEVSLFRLRVLSDHLMLGGEVTIG